MIAGGSSSDWQTQASGSHSGAAASGSVSGTRWSPCAGTTTDSAKAPSTWVPIDRRSGHTFGRPARHWRQCPQVE